MAGMIGVATMSVVNALAAATEETVLQVVAAANHRVEIRGWSITFNGVDAAAAKALVQLVRCSTDGTRSAVPSNNLVKGDDSLAETMLTTAFEIFTVEPTITSILDQVEVSPVDGFIVNYDNEEIMMGGSDRVAIVVTAPAIVSVICKIIFKE